jgi:uncharacterized membrane protein YccC
MNMQITPKSLSLYIAKCLAGCFIVFLLSSIFHYHNIAWCLISIMLVISPDSKEAIPLALSRIKANLAGGAAGFLCMLVHAPEFAIVSASIVLTIVCCYFFKVMASSRSALAAVIIVLLHEPGSHIWDNTLERVLSVVAGCLLGLLVTYLFHKKFLGKDEPVLSEAEDDPL